MSSKLYLGIDPGRSKTGLALVDADGNIKKLRVAATSDLAAELTQFTRDAELASIVIGNGTNSANVEQIAEKVLFGLPFTVIKEAHSTEEARKLYWQVNPPAGWRRIVPLGLLVPPVPLDAYAAVILVRRYLAQNK